MQPPMPDEALPMYCVGSSHMLEWSGSHGPMPSEQHAEKSCVYSASVVI